MKKLKELVRNEVRKTIFEIKMSDMSMPGPGDLYQPPEGEADEWIEKRAEELYEKIIDLPEAFYETVTQEMFDREKELKLDKYPEYRQQDLEVGKGLERFSEFLRNEIKKNRWKVKGIIKVAYEILMKDTERMAEREWDEGPISPEEYE